MGVIDFDLVEKFKKFIDETNCRIVLSSDWKRYFNKDLQATRETTIILFDGLLFGISTMSCFSHSQDNIERDEEGNYYWTTWREYWEGESIDKCKLNIIEEYDTLEEVKEKYKLIEEDHNPLVQFEDTFGYDKVVYLEVKKNDQNN